MLTDIDIYVINLKKDLDRKIYMENILSSYKNGNIHFIEAVYGKELSDSYINEVFDKGLAYNRYGRELNIGEIGCTLSHQKCYRELLNSNNNYVLVLEDDVTLLTDLNQIENLVPYIDVEYPVILFLSGDYWFYNKKFINNDFTLVSVFDAVGSYAYMINRKAAELILRKNIKASFVADNWSLFRMQGIKLKSVYPYMVDANIENFESSIEQSHFGEIRKNMTFSMIVYSLINGLIKRILLSRNMFVSKIRK